MARYGHQQVRSSSFWNGVAEQSPVSSLKAVEVEELRRIGDLVEHDPEKPVAEGVERSFGKIVATIAVALSGHVGVIQHSRIVALIIEPSGQTARDRPESPRSMPACSAIAWLMRQLTRPLPSRNG